ncbi:MAG: hypothetical protein JWO04_4385 [Gammaproteobacteria bacterium]|nr:hypothetical protein [Gammaproteobacteria bacterium]
MIFTAGCPASSSRNDAVVVAAAITRPHKLEPEKSRNFSLGLVLGNRSGPQVSQTGINMFSNGVGTRTRGLRWYAYDRTALSILEDESPRYRFVAGALWTAGNRSMG